MLNPLPQDMYSIPAKLERFEEEFAVLRNEVLGEFRWPLKNLPQDIKPGDTVNIKISSQKMSDDEKYARMRKLLEELIN